MIIIYNKMKYRSMVISVIFVLFFQKYLKAFCNVLKDRKCLCTIFNGKHLKNKNNLKYQSDFSESSIK